MTAACGGVAEPLWDAAVDGETDDERTARHLRALVICRHCPIRRECAADVDVRHDDGIRGGMVLPTIPDKHRRGWRDRRPGRGGMRAVLTGAS